LKNKSEQAVSDAERESHRSRTQVMATLAEIRRRTNPRIVATETADDLLNRANQLLQTTTTTIRTRPVLALSGFAAFMIAIGLRFWLARRKEQ
jgi:hypothetical protein